MKRRWLVLLSICLPFWFSGVAAAAGYSAALHRIPGPDGTPLTAVVMTPQGQGSGPFPLIVMPASWASPSLEYVGRGAELAGRGYIVISFTARGFFTSGGQVDIAGPSTVADVSAVIDWALANTRSDPKAIGASGISYGAGISLLAAARDPRIKAVAALSAWADLQESLASNRTPSAQAMAGLVLSGVVTGRPSPDLAALARLVVLGRFDDAVDYATPLLPVRSPVTEVAKLNASGTAVFLGNSFNDGLFPPDQLVDFYQRLTVPKHLMFSQGDHGTAEVTGALGLPNDVYDAVGLWFDRFLKDRPNGIDTGPKVVLRSQDGASHPYADWSDVLAGATTYYLDRPMGLVALGEQLGASPARAWSSGIITGLPTVADSGVVLISGFLQSLGQAPRASIPLVSRGAAGVWMGPRLATTRRVDGPATLRITVTPGQADTTLYAYLYSVDGLGIGELISHKPYTLRGASPNRPQTVDIRLEPASWVVPAGRRLALVVDTVDLRYAGASRLGGTVTFSSAADAPARLTVPLK
jgi:putative CocE/NonD family hydrolase